MTLPLPLALAQIGNVNIDFGDIVCAGSGAEGASRRAAAEAIADMEMLVVFANTDTGEIGINLALLQSLYPSVVQIQPVRVSANIVNSAAYDFRPSKDESFFKHARAAIIAGGAVGGVLLAAVVAYACYRRHKKIEETVSLPAPGPGLHKKQAEVEQADTAREDEVDVMRAKEKAALLQMQQGTYQPPPPAAPDVIRAEIALDVNQAREASDADRALLEAAALAEAQANLAAVDLEEHDEAHVEIPANDMPRTLVVQNSVLVTADRAVMNALSGAADGDVPAPPMEPPRRRAGW
jgi:hypothetical protein